MLSDIGGTWTSVAGFLALLFIPLFKYVFWNSMSEYFLEKE